MKFELLCCSCFYSKVQFLVIVGQHRLGDRSDHWTCSWRLPRTGIVENVTILGYDLLETVTQFLYASLQKNFQTSFHQTHSLEGILSFIETRYFLLSVILTFGGNLTGSRISYPACAHHSLLLLFLQAVYGCRYVRLL